MKWIVWRYNFALARIQVMKTARKTAKKKSPARRPRLSLDRRLEMLVERAEAGLKAAEADRDRLARLEKEAMKDRRNNENHRRNSSRVLEDAFAASLPRVMKSAHGIVIRPQDVKMRVRKGRKKPEYDFVAPNGKIVLVGEVKTRFTMGDVVKLVGAMTLFRRDFPEFAKLKLYGVAAGGTIDDDALSEALKEGFIVLQMDGAQVHPATGKKYRPTAY